MQGSKHIHFCLSLNQNSRTVSAEASKLREPAAAAAKVVKEQETVKAGPVFELEWDELDTKVNKLDGFPNAEGSNLDVALPYVWNVFEQEDTINLQKNAKFQMMLGGFGGNYKWTQSYKDNFWYQEPVAFGKGLEETVPFLQPFDTAVATAHDDIGSFKAVMAVHWKYGTDPSQQFVGTSRMGLGQLKAQASGQVELLIFLPTKVPDMATIPAAYDDVETWLRNMNEDMMKLLSEAGALLYVLHLPWNVLYVPPGVLVLERTRAGNIFPRFFFKKQN